jgi:hypothetical protein
MAAKKSPRAKTATEVAEKAPKVDSTSSATKEASQTGDRRSTKRRSALDAAAMVLGETGQAMNCKEMIDAMAAKGYWTSPGGQTPQATLYSGILKEIQVKGANTRFKKTGRGTFALDKGGV